MLFESLGLRYFGPVDGHDVYTLIETFNRVKTIKGPVIVHVVTKKGKGYEAAEKNPTKFHSASPFNLETGESLKKKKIGSYTDAFSEALLKLAAEDPGIVAITAAMPDGTGLVNFMREFPQRCFDVGIAEQHAVTFAAGLASQGMKPVIAIYSTFLQRAYDQIIHDVCLQNLPVVFALDRSGLVGADGPTHHGVFGYTYLRHIPNMVVMAPKDEAELQHMVKTAIDYNGPIAFCYPRSSGIGVPKPEEMVSIPIGKGEVVREGGDIVLLAIGPTVYPSMEAADMLSNEGFSPCVVNSRFIKPIDRELILPLIQKSGKVFTIEENSLQGGFGSAIIEMLVQEMKTPDVQIECMGIPDNFIEHGDRGKLLQITGLTADRIYQSVLRMLNSKKGAKTISKIRHIASAARRSFQP
jgi:1-deoxy-D-xylulose-5-phosphate synthase